jgi:hypothetical protein
MKWQHIFHILIAISLSSCGTLKKATLHGLNNGYYHKTNPDGSKQKIYLSVTEDSVICYPVTNKAEINKAEKPDTFYLNTTLSHPVTSGLKLQKTGLDFDITTVLFKYRFKTDALPAQLNANLNLAGYIGYKKEFFNFRDQQHPDGRHTSDLQHFTIDFGILSGFGSTPVNPSTTANRLNIEYDGFVWQNGGAVFVGWNIFTFGIGVGCDILLDQNKNHWIYNGKPWLGLVIGLTLAN